MISRSDLCVLSFRTALSFVVAISRICFRHSYLTLSFYGDQIRFRLVLQAFRMEGQ